MQRSISPKNQPKPRHATLNQQHKCSLHTTLKHPSKMSKKTAHRPLHKRHFHSTYHNPERRDLEGKTAIITGGSRGIGLTTTKLLISRGANIIYCSKTPQSIQSAQESIISAFPSFKALASSEGDATGGNIDGEKGCFKTPIFLSTTSHHTHITPPQFFQGVECDVASEQSIQQFYSAIKQLKSNKDLVFDLTSPSQTTTKPTPLYSGSDILINSAGLCQNQLLLRVGENMIDTIMKVNVNGTMLMTKHFLKQLPVFPSITPPPTESLNLNDDGTPSQPNINTYNTMINNQNYYRVINIGSVVGKQGNPGQSVYATSKAAVDGFTRSMSKEMHSYRNAPITFNSISPGFIETDMTAIMTKEQLDKIVDRVGLKRIGQPEEIANLIAFLASNQSSYINGQNISADGGM